MDGCMGDAHKGCVCEGHLVNACAEQPCGQNAACRVLDHNEAQCYCPEELPYGDAYVECKYIGYIGRSGKLINVWYRKL